MLTLGVIFIKTGKKTKPIKLKQNLNKVKVSIPTIRNQNSNVCICKFFNINTSKKYLKNTNFRNKNFLYFCCIIILFSILFFLIYTVFEYLNLQNTNSMKL